MRPFDISGKSVLIVGGAGLIGSKLSEALVEYGARTYIADIEGSEGQSLADDLGEGATFVPIDVTDPVSVNETIDLIAEEADGIDGAVNCSYPRNDSYGDGLWEVSAESWNENLTLHLGGYFVTARAVARTMRKYECKGSIVNFASIYGIQAPDFDVYSETGIISPVEYSVIKSGIINMTRHFASFLGPEGIRVNAVSPGGIYDNQAETFVENYEQNVPLGRMAEPEDITGAVVYLLSEGAKYVTGHNLVVDGGWTIQ